MTNTGTLTITDSLSDQTRLMTATGLNGASGTSPSYAIGPNTNATLTVQGTWDSATMLVQGSNDGGTTWFTLKNWQNANMSYTANSLDNFGPIPLLIRFSWSGGDSSTALVGYIGFSKNYF